MKKILISIVLFFCFIGLAYAGPMMVQAQSGINYIFSDNWNTASDAGDNWTGEVDDTSEWTAPSDAAVFTFSAAGDTGLLHVNLVSSYTNGIYAEVQMKLSETDLGTSVDNVSVMSFCDKDTGSGLCNNAANGLIMRLLAYNDNDGTEINRVRIGCMEDGGESLSALSDITDMIDDTYHMFKMYYKHETGEATANGVCTVWVDDVQEITDTGLESYNVPGIDRYGIGPITNATSAYAGGEIMTFDNTWVDDEGH